MKGKMIFSAVLVLTGLVQGADLPQDNPVLDNGKARAYIDSRHLSLRLKNVTAAGAEKQVIASVYPTYFGYGTWNLFQLNTKKLIEDQEEPGFNKLEAFEVRKDASGNVREVSNTVANPHFRCKRTFSLLPGQPVFKMDLEWVSLKDNFVQSFGIQATYEKEFSKLVFVHNGERKEIPAGGRYEVPFLKWSSRTDETGRNGAVVMIDNRPYAELTQGPLFTQYGGVSFPGNQHRLIGKGETFRATIYVIPFRDADPVEVAAAAEKTIFGEAGNPEHVWTNRVKPTTGRILKKSTDAVYWRAGIEHVLSDSELPDQAVAAWELTGAANESIHEQLVVTASRNLPEMTVEIGEFRSSDGGVIPAGNVKVSYPKAFTAYLQTTAVSFSGECPDLLDTIPHRELAAGTNYACIFSLKIPADTKAGVYNGHITVAGEKLPLAVRVRDFRLPDYPAFRADFLMWGDQYTTEKNRLPLAAYEKDMRSLRISPGFSSTLVYDADGKVTGNTASAVRNAVLKEHDTSFRIYGVFAQRKFSKQYKMRSPEMDRAMIQFAEVAEKTLKEAGVIDKLLWQHGDETHNEEQLKTQIHYASLTKETAPAIPIFTTINGWHGRIPELVKVCDIMAFHSEIYFNCVKDRMDLAGKEVWQYDNDYMRATAPSAAVRGIMWRAFRQGFKGYHHWGTMSWPKNYTFEYSSNYCGVIYYPPMQDQKSPLRSSRLLNFAAGVADYDYLVLLQNEISRLENHPEAVAAGKELDAMLNRLLPDQWSLNPGYSGILDGRERIGDLIEKLRKL